MRRRPLYLLSTEDRESGLVIRYGVLILSYIVIEGRIIGRRPPGRPRTGMLDRVTDGGPYIAVRGTP